MSWLPYIIIEPPFATPMKFLIDTGSNRSFINPSLICPYTIRKIPPIKMTTVFNSIFIDKEVNVKSFKEFNSDEKINFLLFKFHKYFDGLIGLDILQQLNIKLDFGNSILEVNSNQIPIHYKPNLKSKTFNVKGNTTIVAQIPVDVEEGDILVKEIPIKLDLIIPGGIYKSVGWYAKVEVSNTSDSEQSFTIEQPIKAVPIESNYTEFHNFLITSEVASEEDKHYLFNSLRLNHLNSEEKTSVFNLCKKFNDIFYTNNQKLTFTNQVKHQIKTTDNVPIYSKSYRYPFVHKTEVESQISEMLDQGIIKPSFSPWSSPIWIVPKKLDASGKQKWRLVIDYRKINEKTIDDKYPIPNISDILDKLGKANYFSTLDLASGFHQIEIHPEDVPKTAFTVEHGHYEFVRMPFGLKNAPSTFQRVMDNVLQGLQGKICLVYMDDIIIFSTSLQEHIVNLKSVFERLRQANLKVQLDKSEFLHKEVSFLGHIITSEGVKPNPEKIHAVKNFPIPRTQKEIKAFLGLLGYYRKFINNFANLTKPLTNCLKKGNKVEMSPTYTKCFELCKSLLCNDPILQYPDFEKPFNLTTDASNYALGAILSQGAIGSDRPVCYASRTLSETEQRYSTIEKELLAIVWATKYFRPYLFGHKFKIVTDHKPLTWLFSLKEPNSKLVRWRLRLEEYDYEILYKKGKQNTNADALSRVEINTSETSDSQDTIHSALQNLGDGIPISERPLNEFSFRLIFQKTDLRYNPKDMTKIFFNTKKQVTIRRNDLDKEEIILEKLKSYLIPKKTIGVHTDDNTFKLIQSTFSKYFSNSTSKLVRCKSIRKDVENIDSQEQLIMEYHNQSVHRGINETVLHLKREYYFPKMKEIITRIINNCQICGFNKYERQNTHLKFALTETPKKPLEILHIDIYSVHKEVFLTILDKFSKFAAVYMIPSRNSLNLVTSLTHFFSHHGVPQKIVSDNGQEFISSVFQDFLKLHKIENHLTSAKNSTGNAPVERFHSTLTELIRILYSQNKTKPIEDIVNEAVLAYNSSIHSVTKVTPFELLSGHIDSDLFPQITNTNPDSDYVQQRKEIYNQITDIIHQRNLSYKQNMLKKLNDNKCDPPNFQPNENILEADNRRNKLAPRFMSHKILKNNRYTVITNRRKVHKSKIKSKRKFSGQQPASG